MGIVASFVDSPDLPANSSELPRDQDTHVCRATTITRAVRREPFHRTPCASISRTCLASRRTARSVQRSPLQVVGASSVAGRGRGERRASSIRWNNCASTRPNWPIGCNRSRARSNGASRRWRRRKPTLTRSGRACAHGSASVSRSSKSVPSRSLPRAGAGRARGGGRGAGDGADAGSRGSARRTREPAGQSVGRS